MRERRDMAILQWSSQTKADAGIGVQDMIPFEEENADLYVFPDWKWFISDDMLELEDEGLIDEGEEEETLVDDELFELLMMGGK